MPPSTSKPPARVVQATLTVPLPKALLFAARSVPPLTVTAPVKLLPLASSQAPAPLFASAPVPLIIPETVPRLPPSPAKVSVCPAVATGAFRFSAVPPSRLMLAAEPSVIGPVQVALAPALTRNAPFAEVPVPFSVSGWFAARLA